MLNWYEESERLRKQMKHIEHPTRWWERPISDHPIDKSQYRGNEIMEWWFCIVLGLITLFACGTILFSCSDHEKAYADEGLKASWYSVQSLKTEGTWKYSKGVMANGEKFKDEALTCATRLFKLGDCIRITNNANGKTVDVMVTDRIGKRFAKTRIDLSKSAFEKIADLKEGLVPISVEVIHV
jgi:rare lipoprotein A